IDAIAALVGVAAARRNRPTSRAANTAATVRNRRVQASFDVRPLSVRPTGAITITTAVTSAITDRLKALSDAVTAATARSRLTWLALHQRMAKRVTDRGR